MLLEAIFLAAVISQDQPVNNDCEHPPPGSDQSVIDCYDDACAAMQSAVDACAGTKECIAAARFQYQLALIECQPTTSTSADLVIWNDGESWNIAWPGEEFPALSVQLKFNI